MINTKTLFRVDLSSLLSRIQKIYQLENSLSNSLYHDSFNSSDVKNAKDLLKLDSKSVLDLLTLLREKSQNFELFDFSDINELFDSVQKNTNKEMLSQFEIYEDYCKRRKAYFKEKNSYHTPEEIQDLFDKKKYELAYPSVVYYHEKQHDTRMHSKLAFYYENGIKVKKDLAKARELYEKAVLEAEEFEYCFKLYQLFSDNLCKAKEYVNLGAKHGIDSCIKEKEKLDADDYLNGIKNRAFNDKSYKSDYPKMLEEARNGDLDFQAFIVIANYSGVYTGLNQKEIQKFLLNVTESKIDSRLIIKCVLSVAKYYKGRKDSQDFEKEIFQYKKIAHDLGDHTQSIDLALMSFYQRNYQDASTYFNEAFKNKISSCSLALNECVNYGRKQSAIYQDKKNEDNRKLADDVFHFCIELGEKSCFYDLATLYMDDYPEIAMDYILNFSRLMLPSSDYQSGF